MAPRNLRKQLNTIYTKYHDRSYLGIDPLTVVHRYSDPDEIEIVGLVASCLAYGKVELIIRAIEKIIDLAGGDLLSLTKETPYSTKRSTLADFRHRFNDGLDIAVLLESARQVRDQYGSLHEAFLTCLGETDGTMKPAMHRFVSILRERGMKLLGYSKRSFEYMLPSPHDGSACKRLNMYFRWMVRPADGIDFGLWKGISPAILIIPVDVHVLRVARSLGLTGRSRADWRAAEEVTSGLRSVEPADPTKYDFSLCRYGMIEHGS